MDIHLVTSICILKTYYFGNLFASLIYRYDCGGGREGIMATISDAGRSRWLSVRIKVELKKYICILPLSGIKRIHFEDNRFDFLSEHFLSDRFGII